jgi:hypothetical protein
MNTTEAPERTTSVSGADIDVALVRWPEEAERSVALAAAGAAQLLLVEPGADLPETWGQLTDWIRMPADHEDVWIRIATLQRRAAPPAPRLDEFDVLWRGTSWVALSPLEARIVATMLENPVTVLERATISAAAWPDGGRDPRLVDAYVKRLRRRIPALGLTIHTVRGRGYLLEVEPLPDA